MEGIKQTEERQGARPEIATKVMVVFTDGYYNKGFYRIVALTKASARSGFKPVCYSYQDCEEHKKHYHNRPGGKLFICAIM